MSVARAKPGNLVAAETVPFAQHFTYHDVLSVESMLEPGFFASCKSNLRAGDRIDLVSVTDNRARAVAEVMVVEVRAREVEIYVLRPPTVIPGSLTVDPVPENAGRPMTGVEVRQGFGCWLVVDAGGREIAEFPKKAGAEAHKNALEAGAPSVVTPPAP